MAAPGTRVGAAVCGLLLALATVVGTACIPWGRQAPIPTPTIVPAPTAAPFPTPAIVATNNPSAEAPYLPLPTALPTPTLPPSVATLVPLPRWLLAPPPEPALTPAPTDVVPVPTDLPLRS